MKKLLIFTGYYLPRVGGSINHIHQITRRLANQGYDIDIVTLNSDNLIEYEVIDTVAIYRLPSLHLLENYELLALNHKSLTILKKIFNKKYDIVLNYTRFHLTSLLALTYCKIKHVPYIHTELGSSHSILANKLMELISHIYDHTLGYLVVTNADQLIVNCFAGGEFLQHIGGNHDKINVIFSGINKEIFLQPANCKNRLKDDDRKRIITIISRLIYAKGIQDAILAFGKIQKKYPDNQLLIIGDGSYQNQLKTLIIENQINNVYFLGFLEQRKIAQILSITDLIINPSYSESLISSSVLEGGIMRIPSISTDVGGTCEVIKDGINGLLFKPSDIDHLSGQIELLLNDDILYGILAENIKKFMVDYGDWDLVTKKHIELINKIAGSLK